MSRKRGILALALLAALCVSNATKAADESREVTLRMKGGGFQVTGEIRAFDGTKYVVESPELGRLTLQAARFDCVGAACTLPSMPTAWSYEPLSAERHESVTMRGTDVLAQTVMPALVRGFAASAGMTASQVIGTDGEVRLRLIDKNAREVAAFDIRRDDSTTALAAVERAAASIAFTDRAATKDEAEALAAASAKTRVTDTELPIGLDAIAIVVAPDNPATSLPADAIARIFSGALTDWYELGQAPGRIRIVLHGAGGESAERLQSVLLKPRNLKLAGAFERAASEAELADTVARDRTAIGLVSLASVRNAKTVPIESSCGLTLRPTAFAARTGEYPLARRLYLYAAAPPKQAAARGLMRFAASADAHAIVSDHLIASQGLESLAIGEQAERMAFALNAQGEAFDLAQMRAMLADLKGHRRIATTFRFVPGTQDFDASSKAEIARLAMLLQSPELSGKRVTLAGFTDNNGGKFQANLAHSFKRANAVRIALLQAGGARLDARLIGIKGYGPLAPVACNDTAEGHRLNRRVEVWVRD